MVVLPSAIRSVGTRLRVRVRGVADAVDAATVESLDAQRPAIDQHLVADHRKSSELVHHKARDRLVRALFWNVDARTFEQFVRTQDAGKCE
jgi:hypothetical protein